MRARLTNYLWKVWRQAAGDNNARVASLVEATETASLLDLGCDDGTVVLERVKDKIETPSISGLDSSPQKVALAKKKGVQAQVANLEHPFPYASDSFDLVTANQIIEHLVNIDGFLREIHRVLKPGGYLILSTENLSSWHNIAALLLGWQAFSQHLSAVRSVGNPLRFFNYSKSVPENLHLRIFTPRGLREIVEVHRLVVERTFSAGYYPFPSPVSGLFSAVDRIHSVYIGVKARKPKSDEYEES